MLRVIKPYVTKEQICYIGNSIINSILLYAAPIWSLTTDLNLDRLQKAQTKTARTIVWDPKNSKKRIKEHRQVLFTDIKWLNVRQLATSAILNIVKMGAENSSAAGINTLFTYNPKTNSRTCNNDKLNNKCSTKRKGKNLLETGVKLFNTLPPDLRTRKISKYAFKKGVKAYILELHHLTVH